MFRKCKNKSRKITQLCVRCLCACTTVYLKQMPTEVWWWKRQLQKYTIWKCVIRHRAEAGANVDTNIGTTTSVHDMFKTSVKNAYDRMETWSLPKIRLWKMNTAAEDGSAKLALKFSKTQRTQTRWVQRFKGAEFSGSCKRFNDFLERYS